MPAKAFIKLHSCVSGQLTTIAEETKVLISVTPTKVSDPWGDFSATKSYDGLIAWTAFYTNYKPLMMKWTLVLTNQDVTEDYFFWIVPSHDGSAPLTADHTFEHMCSTPRIKYRRQNLFVTGKNMPQRSISYKLYVKEFMKSREPDLDYPSDINGILAGAAPVHFPTLHFGITTANTVALTVGKKINVIMYLTLFLELTERKSLLDET